MLLILTHFLFSVTVVYSINVNDPEGTTKELSPRITISYPFGFNVTLTNPDYNIAIDYYGKITNPYILYDTPDIQFGKFIRVDETTVMYTNTGGTFYSYDVLHVFLIMRVREHLGLRTVFIPLRISM